MMRGWPGNGWLKGPGSVLCGIRPFVWLSALQSCACNLCLCFLQAVGLLSVCEICAYCWQL
ncbi:hypothetical protein PT7_0732 [Pusillimonas sp. T7-7]|nr:hypothetical protein PT7_0732 [Pusillimonas sp. T7-7]